MSHMFLTFCRQRGRTEGVALDHDGRDRMDPSPRDRKSSTCVNVILSGRDRKAHRAPRGVTRSYDCHQRDRDQTATMKPISFSSWRHQDHQISIKADDRNRQLTWRFVGTVRSSSNRRLTRLNRMVVECTRLSIKTKS